MRSLCLWIMTFLVHKVAVAGEVIGHHTPEETVAAEGHKNEVTTSSSTSESDFSYLIDEIQEVETMIALQTRKLELLKLIRHRSLAGERPNSESIRELLNSLSHPHSTVSSVDGSKNEEAAVSSPEWQKHLLLKLDLSLNYTIAASLIVSAKVKRLPGQNGAEMLFVLVDTEGYLHILIESGDEILLHYLNHAASVTAIAFDGTDLKKTVLITAAMDGSVHVLNMELVRNTSLSAKQTLSVEISPNAKYKLSEVLNSDIKSAAEYASEPYATSILIYVKQSVKSFVLLIGDSVGRVTHCDLNGDHFNTHVIQAGEPILSMTRLGQLVAIAAGHEVHMHVMGRFHLTPKICMSGGVVAEHKISRITMDAGSSPYLFAKTVQGRILTFDTKAKTPNAIGRTEVVCALISASEPLSQGSLLAVKNYVIASNGHDMHLYDSSHLKTSMKLNLISAVPARNDSCNHSLVGDPTNDSRSGLWFDGIYVMPRNERQRATEALLLVTVNCVRKEETLMDSSEENGPQCNGTNGRPLASRIQLYSTISNKDDSDANSLVGELLKSMGGWIRIPLILGGFLIAFLWKGGSSLFSRKSSGRKYGIGSKKGGSRFGLDAIDLDDIGAIDEEDEDLDSADAPSVGGKGLMKYSKYRKSTNGGSSSTTSYYGGSGVRTSTNNTMIGSSDGLAHKGNSFSNSKGTATFTDHTNKAMEDIRSLDNELERLKNLTEELRKRSPD